MKRALLIGIRTTPNIPASFGLPLRGCHNDVERMATILLGKYAFDDVRVLVDKLQPATAEIEDELRQCSCLFCVSPENIPLPNCRLVEDCPTRDAIRSAVEELTHDVAPGDVVALHYSGHGSEFWGSGPHVGRRFQTLVSHDSGRGGPPNRDIFDTEVDLWIRRLNEKTPYVTFIFDSCHSGGVTDGSRSGAEHSGRRVGSDRRPMETAFDGPGPDRHLSDSIEQLDEELRAQQPATRGGDPTEAARTPSGWVRGDRSAVILAGCRSHQLSKETTDGGKHFGRFTYELTRTLEATTETRWSHVFPTVLTSFRRSTQQPQREGDAAIFAAGDVDPRDHYPPHVVELKKFAVVIGIDYDGRDESEGFSPLKTPANDAREVARVLREEQGYQIIGLDGAKPLLNEQATRKNIHLLLDKLAVKTQLRRNAAVVIYFAGHGEVDPDDRGGFHGYLVPWDASRHDSSTWMPMLDLRDHLKEGIRDEQRLTELNIDEPQELRPLDAAHLLLVLDCCFAGAMAVDWFLRGQMPERPIYYSEYKRFVEGTAWRLLSSATRSQRARDVDPRAGEGAHSPFASAFIRGLRTDNADGFRSGSGADHIITATELHQYIDQQLKAISGDEVAVQTPSLMDLKPKDGEFVFTVPGWVAKPEPDPPFHRDANPWWGARSYESTRNVTGDDGKESAEDPLFFGQQRATLRLLERIISPASQPILLVGTSASGKSSVVRAGLLPLLADPVAGRRRVRTWLNRLGWDRYLASPDGTEPLREWAIAQGLHELLGDPEALADEVKRLVEQARKDGVFASARAAADEQLARTEAERLGVGVLLERSEREKRAASAERLRILDFMDSPLELVHEVELWLSGIPALLTAEEGTFRKAIGTWSVHELRFGTDRDPVEQLREAEDVVRDWSADDRKLLFVDQLDVLVNPDLPDRLRVRQAFRSTFDALTHAGGQLLATLRSDALGRSDRSDKLAELIDERVELELPTPRYDDLREVVELPAATSALTFEPLQLIEDIIEDVKQCPAPLSLLSAALANTFDAAVDRRRDGRHTLDRSLTPGDWKSAGGIGGDITKHLDALDESYQLRRGYAKVHRHILSRFIELNDASEPGKRPVSWRELDFRTLPERKRAEVVIEDLIRAQVVISNREGLVLASTKLFDWKPLQPLIQNHAAMTLAREVWKAATDWHDTGGDRAKLWNNDPRLSHVLHLKPTLNRLERDFVRASEKAQRESVARQLASAATRIAGVDWSRGALLAVEAAEWSKGTPALQALHDVLGWTPLSIPFRLPGAVLGMEFSVEDRSLRIAFRATTESDDEPVAWVLDLDTFQCTLQSQDVPSGEGRVRPDPAPSMKPNRRSPELDLSGMAIGRIQLLGHRGAPQFFAASEGGEWLASGLTVPEEGIAEIRLWRIRRGAALAHTVDAAPSEIFPGEPAVLRGLAVQDEQLEHVCFTPAGGLVATRYELQPLTWDLHTTWPSPKLVDTGERVLWSSVEGPPGSGRAPRLWSGRSAQGSLAIRDLSSDDSNRIEVGFDQGVARLVAVSDDAEVIVARVDDSSQSREVVRVWNRGRAEAELAAPPPFRLQEVAITPDGAFLAAVGTTQSEYGQQSSCWLWRTDNPAEPVCRIPLPERDTPIHRIGFDPYGRWLMTLAGGRVSLWSVSSGEPVTPRWPVSFKPEHEVATSAAFSGDGRWLCVGTLDGDVLLIDLTADLIGRFLAPGAAGSVDSLVFDATSQRVAVGARAMAHVWQLGDGDSLPGPPLYLKSERRRGLRVRALRFDNTGTRLSVLLRDEYERQPDRVAVHRLDVNELVSLAAANAGRELTREEKTKFLPDDSGVRRSARAQHDGGALHRAIVVGERDSFTTELHPIEQERRTP